LLDFPITPARGSDAIVFCDKRTVRSVGLRGTEFAIRDVAVNQGNQPWLICERELFVLADGEITLIKDLATGVSTAYTYDLLGHRLSELITTPGDVADRNTTYQYDALGQLVRWSDAVTHDNLNTQYDAEGNVAREYTDNAYDPLSQNSGANPNYRYVDHVYTYDADRRVVQVRTYSSTCLTMAARSFGQLGIEGSPQRARRR
jgi:YD repeat-containing protein